MDGHDGHDTNGNGLGAPGSHETGGTLGHAEHGGHHGDGHVGGHHDKYGKASIVFSHDQHGHGVKFSFPAAMDAHPSQGGTGPAAAVDPIPDPTFADPSLNVMTRTQALRSSGEKPTILMMAHEVHHAYVDREKTFRRIAEETSKKLFGSKRKLIRIDDHVPGIDGSNKPPKSYILAWHALSEDPNNRDNMPDGWSPTNNEGTTLVVQECWQLGKWDPETYRYEYDRLADTYLQLIWVIWYYKKTGTYETKFESRVNSGPEYDRFANDGFGAYGIVAQAFDEHQLMSVHIAKEISLALHASQPDKLSRQMMKRYGVDSKTGQHKTGSFPGSADEETEIENADWEKAQRKDSDPNVNPGNAPPPVAPPPGGIGYLVEDGDDIDLGTDAPPVVPIAPIGVVDSGTDLENVLPPVAKPPVKPTGDRVPVWQPPKRGAPAKVQVDAVKKS